MGDYYTSVSLARNTLAKAEDINSRTESIEAGFDMLPNPHASAPSTKGFDEVFKVVDATARDHPASVGQVQDGSTTYVLDTGAADAYVATLAPVITSYVAGLRITLKAINANTGASTLNVSGLGAKSITDQSGASIAADVIKSGGVYAFVYDGTNFQIDSILTTDAVVLDEDDMASNSATAVPSQQSTKAYADSKLGGLVSANDTTQGYLDGKLVAGDSISFTKGSPGGDETLIIESTVGATLGTIKAHGTVTGNTVFDIDDGYTHTITVNADITLSFSNFTSGTHETVMVVLTDTGDRTITWDSAIKWPDGTAPVHTASSRNRFIFASEDGGTTIDGGFAGGGFA